MLALAGLPGTAGFIGKLYLIEASVDGDYTWLAVMIAVGTMISLAYYLRGDRGRLDAPCVPRRPDSRDGPQGAAGDGRGSPEAGRGEFAGTAVAREGRIGGIRCPVIIGLTIVRAAATVFFGIIPSPLVDFVSGAGESILAGLS